MAPPAEPAGSPRTTYDARRTQNNASVGILIEYGQFRALFTGDSEQEELCYWLASAAIPRVNVLKLAHHGSANGTSAGWIAATKPQVAIISVGAGNSYGHPSALVISQWRNAGARVYRTDVAGTILIVANDDGSFVVTTERGGSSAIVRIHPFSQDTAPAP